MTAAHKTLPFNTHVQVTVAGGRSAVVRINDRGPFVPGRILDVTPRGADVLGFRNKGIVQCHIQTAGRGKPFGPDYFRYNALGLKTTLIWTNILMMK